ncbi:MAG TPA: hypothetical protein VK879_20345 [Candidatus Sulfomarinibacteraceae bacterium]|nr:hypothetical protein [Candidatus Sulfomarinibacteraceae bacterium]
MDEIYVFLIRNDVWIYILCALGLLWFFSELVRSLGALRRAMFRLERETALRTRNSSLFFITLLSSIIIVVAYVNIQVRPTLPPELLRPPTPTPESGLAPASTPTEEVTDMAPTPTSPIPPTVTLSGDSAPVTDTVTNTVPITVEDVSDETQPEPPGSVAGCTDDVSITDPPNEGTVRGALTVYGSANPDQFGEYELHIRGPQTNDRWADLLSRAVTEPIDDGILAGNLNLSEWSSGPYQLRLTVTHTDGNITHQCAITIRLDNN